MVEKPQSLQESDCVIRLYQAGDEDKLVKLLVDVFKPWPQIDLDCSLLDHWKWKFIDNPAYKDTSPHVVAEYKGEIIGVSHGMWYYTKVGDETYFSSKGADVVVNQNYRGMRVFTRISELKDKTNTNYGRQFSYGLTENPLLINRTSRPTPNFLFPLPLKNLLKIENINKFFTHYLKETNPWRRLYLKIGLIGSKMVNRLSNMQPKTPELKDVQFKEISTFDERIDKFYDKIKPNYYFIVGRTMKYMNWRYCDKRGGDFKVWVAEKNDEIIGYLVLRVNSLDKDNPVGYIIDVLALNGREDVVDYFVKFSVDYFKAKGLNMVRAQLVGGHAYERILNKYGFLDGGSKSHLTYTPHLAAAEDIDKFRKAPATMLHYPYGEGDTI